MGLPFQPGTSLTFDKLHNTPSKLLRRHYTGLNDRFLYRQTYGQVVATYPGPLITFRVRFLDAAILTLVHR
jgi:hypothetical protein